MTAARGLFRCPCCIERDADAAPALIGLHGKRSQQQRLVGTDR